MPDQPEPTLANPFSQFIKENSVHLGFCDDHPAIPRFGADDEEL
jgi:hypothetical protein